ncbi:MAG: bifunctional 4-hydroxy-3-methylbut-2-enyl diphosphate reductase/30S ribosomal protein S1, partial [Candidatus Omnitrophota bacterium]|nr:bifunctional 4-hydroxy-3-methylbut-2-enyl diphosphate reductase/30S ribosomal protein S1 [Candidatus Omnitrophota bacterium]
MALRVNIPEFSDFCFGVKRAISLAEGALEKSAKPVFSLGPLIHNRQVVERLSKKGLKITGDFKKIKYGTIVICAHGTRPGIIKKIKKKKINIVDTTCPYVKNAQRISERLSREGYTLIITGDKGHPEVKSLMSFSGNKSAAVTTKNEAKRLKLGGSKIGVIAQTTQSSKNFLEVVSELLQKEFDE